MAGNVKLKFAAIWLGVFSSFFSISSIRRRLSSARAFQGEPTSVQYFKNYLSERDLMPRSQPILGAAARSRRVPDSHVELEDIPVMRVKADMKAKGPSAAFGLLESKLPTLRGRKFYGAYHQGPEDEEYYACVAKVETDDPDRMQLEAWVIPGGKFVRRRVMDWEKVVNAGQLPKLFTELLEAHSSEFDPARFSLEFYRSQTELHLLLPVRRA